MQEVQAFMTDTHEWAENTFGKGRSPVPTLHHLSIEVDELIEALTAENPEAYNIEMEFADCFILILNAASLYGMTFQDLMNAAIYKMAINKKRVWGKPDGNGVVEHIEQ